MAAVTHITSSVGTHDPAMKHGHSCISDHITSSVGTHGPAMKHGHSCIIKRAVIGGHVHALVLLVQLLQDVAEVFLDGLRQI